MRHLFVSKDFRMKRLHEGHCAKAMDAKTENVKARMQQMGKMIDRAELRNHHATPHDEDAHDIMGMLLFQNDNFHKDVVSDIANGSHRSSNVIDELDGFVHGIELRLLFEVCI